MNLLQAKRWGRYLALFAMMVQLAFAFGHIHDKQFHVDGRLVLAAKSLFTQASPRLTQASPRLTQAPHKFIQVPQRHDHQDCQHHRDNDQKNENSQICLTLAAANSAVLPVIAGVVWHFKSFDSHRVVESTVLVSRHFFYSYRVRAPPFAPIV